MVMIVLADIELARVAPEARTALMVHSAEADGLCRGCYEMSCRFAWYPCPVARWAQAVEAASIAAGTQS